MTTTVGVLGLGIMGGAMARNLVGQGFPVLGYDPSSEASDRLAAHGGRPCASIAEVLAGAAIVVTSLATEEVFKTVVSTIAGLPVRGKRIVDVSTLPIASKSWACETLAEAGAVLLDCPVSGTGAQAATRDLVVFGSGGQSDYEAVREVLGGLSRRQLYLGAFGNGSRMKFIANLLVAIHNVSTAEALTLAGKAGMDPQAVYDALHDSAGSSRMFQVRGPLMVADDYARPTARIAAFMKDLSLIADFAHALECPTPLFAASRQLYLAASAAGLAEADTAAVCRVLESMAHLERHAEGVP